MNVALSNQGDFFFKELALGLFESCFFRESCLKCIYLLWRTNIKNNQEFNLHYQIYFWYEAYELH